MPAGESLSAALPSNRASSSCAAQTRSPQTLSPAGRARQTLSQARAAKAFPHGGGRGKAPDAPSRGRLEGRRGPMECRNAKFKCYNNIINLFAVPVEDARRLEGRRGPPPGLCSLRVAPSRRAFECPQAGQGRRAVASESGLSKRSTCARAQLVRVSESGRPSSSRRRFVAAVESQPHACMTARRGTRGTEQPRSSACGDHHVESQPRARIDRRHRCPVHGDSPPGPRRRPGPQSHPHRKPAQSGPQPAAGLNPRLTARRVCVEARARARRPGAGTGTERTRTGAPG